MHEFGEEHDDASAVLVKRLESRHATVGQPQGYGGGSGSPQEAAATGGRCDKAEGRVDWR